MGFTLHFYIIFGTNLSTESLVRIVAFFAYFSVSQKRNIKQNPNGIKPSGELFFGTNVIQETWSGRQATNEATMRVPRMPPRGGHAPTLVGPSSFNQRTSFAYIYSRTLKTSEATTKT